MESYRDPNTEYIDAIRDWSEFLEVLDCWENVTASYWDIEHPDTIFSISGRYGWWATILSDWIINQTKVSPEPLLAITRMLQAKDPLGQWREFLASTDEIHRKRLEWLPYKRMLIQQAERAIPNADANNEARDKFCFEEWQAGRSHKEINAELRRHPEWEEFDKDAKVRGPIKAWGKRIGVEPRLGQPGRRAKTK